MSLIQRSESLMRFLMMLIQSLHLQEKMMTSTSMMSLNLKVATLYLQNLDSSHLKRKSFWPIK